ncbi:AsmA family protein [Ehrlichia ruminantium]|uniref:AsmA family protein n=1 Tax=Ehrlichia ruminantium TaxID=779 RepID=A0AAE6Q8K6_EHRRU|nr:AsmA family protein [Ehrlichia ruminantium]QGR02207.1 AsmA family protein [Ehrlichia ruminantium]QGR03129.1 AsmA family protein [Ehrlichia ruminantium]QGR04054.1 AsmA family protein [Ehrlichia ruminantium]
MKFLVYCSSVVLVFVLFLIVSPFFINWNSYYASHVLKQIENISNDISVKGVSNVTGSLILPKIVVSNLYVERGDELSSYKSAILIERLELKISLLSLLLFSPKVYAITVDGLSMPLGSFVDIFTTFKKDSFQISNFNIINSVINTHNDRTSFNSKPIYIKEGSVKTVHGAKVISGLLDIGKNSYTLSGDVLLEKEQYRITGDISSEFTKVTLSGVSYDNKFDGVIVAKGSNFSQFINDFSETNKTSIFSFINSHEEFSLSSNIKLMDKTFELTDFKVATGSLNGTGHIVCSDYYSCNINVDFSKIDIDYLSNDNEANYSNKGSRTLDHFSTLVSKDLNYRVRVNVKEIKYRNQVSNNLVMDLDISDGKVNVDRMVVMLPGDNNILHVEGSINSNDLVSSFNGKIKIDGYDFRSFTSWLFPLDCSVKESSNEFSLQSDVYIAPRIFSLSNIKVLTNGFGDLKGQLKIKYDKKSSFISGNVDIYHANFDKYNVNTKLDVENFMRMKWLKDIKYKVKFDTNVSDSIIRARHVNDLNFSIGVVQGKFSVDKIHFNATDGSNLEGFVKVSIRPQDVRPKMSVQLRSNKYNSDFMVFPSLIRRVFDDSKKVINIKWSDNDLNFYGLEHVDGDINIEIKDLFSKNNNLIDFVFLASLKDSLMSINKLMFKMDEGFVSASGKIGIGSTSSLSAVMSIANIGLDKLLNNININGVTGNVSISGSVQTQGKTITDWVNFLDGKMEFVAKGVNIAGIDLNKFITDLLDTKSKSEIAALSQISLYNNNTVFNFVNAGANIKRGTIASSLQFAIDNAGGVASANISLLQFALISMLRLSFIPPGMSSPSHVDMSVQGQLWQPKITFDINNLYDMVRKSTVDVVETEDSET